MSNLAGLINRLVRRIERLEAGANLESSSITNGRMRFIGGLLRVDSGGRVEIVGTLQIDGATTVNGTFKIEGPWSLNGNGEIAGNVTVTGKLTQNGAWEFVGAGKITGNVDVTGTIRVLAGGKIQVGNITLDPSSNGGSVKFAGGPEVYASGSTLSLYSGALNGGWVELSPGLAKVSGGGTRWIEVTPNGFRLVNLPTIARNSANNAVVGTLWADGSGNVYRVV